MFEVGKHGLRGLSRSSLHVVHDAASGTVAIVPCTSSTAAAPCPAATDDGDVVDDGTRVAE